MLVFICHLWWNLQSVEVIFNADFIFFTTVTLKIVKCMIYLEVIKKFTYGGWEILSNAIRFIIYFFNNHSDLRKLLFQKKSFFLLRNTEIEAGSTKNGSTVNRINTFIKHFLLPMAPTISYNHFQSWFHFLQLLFSVGET